MTDIQDTLDAYGIKLDATFLPASGFKDDEWRSKSINHAITLTRGGVCIQTKYSQGVAHLEGYSFNDRCIDHANRVVKSLETGYNHMGNGFTPKKLPPPSIVDVVNSLLLDGSGSVHNFGEWCSDYGYDNDSIQALETFKACRDTALNLRAMFTPDELAELDTLYEDY